MKFTYDLHIHSALSPCAENDMTPFTIVGTAKILGLDFVAVSDHNSTRSVEVAIRAGEEYGVKVVPAIEVQTKEDVHVLCLFKTYKDLTAFASEIPFSKRKNREDIFGEQLVLDEDDAVVDKEESMLLDSADISSDDLPALAMRYDGVAIPAHIDREGNGMVAILGSISNAYPTVELSSKCDESDFEKWKDRLIIVDSDAHVLDDISQKGSIDLDEYSVSALVDRLKQGK